MAEALLVTCAEGAVKVLIGKLARVLSHELQLLQGVEKEVHYIKGELEGMQSFLSNLARSEDHNDQVKTWMKQVREMAYDAEDCIDQFLHQMVAYHPHAGLDHVKNDKEQTDSSIKRLRNAWSDVKVCSKNILYQLKTSHCSCNVDIFSNSFLHKLMLRRKLGSRIQDLRRRAEDVSKRNLSYGVSIEGNGNGTIAGRDSELGRSLQAGPIDNNLLSGIDEPANELMKCLRKEGAERRVLSIVGLGGLGKTTLAKVVYEHSTTIAEYDCQAFVTVSQKFDLRRLLTDILKQINRTVDFDQSDITMNDVHKRLKDMKYLVVLDDAWSINVWESIRPAFPDEHGSRIIITTRIEAVANACCSEEADIYRIKPLNYKYAHKLFWNILGYDANGSDCIFKGSITSMETLETGDSSGAGKSHASSSGHSEVTVSQYVEHTENEIIDYSTRTEDLKFGDFSGKAKSQDVEPTGNEIKSGGLENSKCNHASPLKTQFAPRSVQLEHAANKIIKKCGGMPLAIIYIAKVLASKQGTMEEWDKFCNSISSQMENHPSLDGMKQILTLSFNSLPYHLKSCFLYLSIYPEDYEIRRKNLVRRWVAEGFVAARRGMSAEEVAESYFEELLGRSIIQRGKVGYSGKIKTCRVHDIMLEVIVSKSIEENFITIIGEQFVGVPHDTIRRLSAQNISKKEHVRVGGNLFQVRSFTAFGDVDRYIWSFTFELLRVLDLEGCKGLRNARLDNMCKLFLLRFLSLRRTEIMNLPGKIGDLKELETLDIRRTMVQMLPVGITKLRLLSHLLAGSKRIRRDNDYRYLISDVQVSDVQMPKQFDYMESVQTLSVIRMPESPADLISLKMLTKLKKLGLYIFPENRECNDAWIDVLQNLLNTLRSLIITGFDSGISLKFLHGIQIHYPLPLQSLELRGELGTLPLWIRQLRNVTEITLCYSMLTWEDSMNVLPKLPNLLSLMLQPLSIIINDLDLVLDVVAGFNVLKTFVIDEGNFPKVKFLEHSMPLLEKIELSLTTIKGLDGLMNLGNLKEVFLQGPDNDSFEDTVDHVKEAVRNLPSDRNRPTVKVVKYPE